MKLSYNMAGGQTLVKNYPMYGNGSNISEGAAVMKGATPGTNQGFCILATGALAKIVGVLTTLHTNTAAGSDSKQDGTTYTKKQVIINPDAVYLTRQLGTIAVASTSTTTVTITSLEDDIDGGWLLGSDNQLQYLTAAAAGSCTTKSSTGWTSSITVTKIHPLFFALVAISSDATYLNNAAAAGTGKVIYFENYITSKGIGLQPLDPTKHSGVTYDSSVQIYSEISFRDHAFAITNY